MAEPSSAMVIGASGKVGRRVCQALRNGGREVIGVARFSDPAVRAGLESQGVQTIPFDAYRDDPKVLPEARVLYLEIWDPGRYGDPNGPDLIWKLNYEFIGRLALRFAGKADFINGSTGNIYGPGPEPARESDPLRPVGDYALSRLAQEKFLDLVGRERGSRVLHLRYYHSNTPEAGLFRRTADKVLRGQTLGPHPDQRIQGIGIKDFVRCTVLAEERLADSPRAVNVCHPTVWTMQSLSERLRKELGRGRVVFDAEHGGEAESFTGDTTLMVREFGPPEENLDLLIKGTCEAAIRDAEASGGGTMGR